MRFSVGAALALASVAAAFRDSSPLLVWSNEPNDMLAEAAAEVNSGVISADTIFGSLSSIGCDWDAVILAHMDELHESHIAAMDLPLGGKSSADLHIPYLVRPARDALDVSVQSWARRCGAQVVDSYDDSVDSPQIVYVNAKHGDLQLPANLPEKKLVVLTGTRDLSAKAHSDRDERPVEIEKKPKRPGTNDTNPPEEHYVYFTTPLLSALFISFGILLPILMFGLYSLAGVQVPPRMMDINKSASVTKSRKDQ